MLTDRKTLAGLAAAVFGCLVCVFIAFLGAGAVRPATPTVIALATPAAATTATETATPLPLATGVPVPTGTPEAADTPEPTDTATGTPMPSETPIDTPTPPDTPTGTRPPTSTPTLTRTPTNTPTVTPTPTRTPSRTPTRTRTPTATPDKSGPIISSIVVSPTLLAYACFPPDNVDVSADVSDPAGITSVTAYASYYRVNPTQVLSGLYPAQMAIRQVIVPGSGTRTFYAGRMDTSQAPSYLHGDDGLYHYYISATDKLGNVTNSPPNDIYIKWYVCIQ